MKKTDRSTSKANMSNLFSDPHYQGKHVVMVGGKVYTAKTGKKAGQILEKVHRTYPGQTPQITFIPDADTLIL